MIKIGIKIISYKRPPLIAEISANHKGSFKRALKLVKLAAQSGLTTSCKLTILTQLL